MLNPFNRYTVEITSRDKADVSYVRVKFHTRGAAEQYATTIRAASRAADVEVTRV